MGWDVLFSLFSVGTRLELPGSPSAPLGSGISSVGAGVGEEELLWAQRSFFLEVVSWDSVIWVGI